MQIHYSTGPQDQAVFRSGITKLVLHIFKYQSQYININIIIFQNVFSTLPSYFDRRNVYFLLQIILLHSEMILRHLYVPMVIVVQYHSPVLLR